jgi:prepilin-type processing-associated H-X9-DG protein
MGWRQGLRFSLVLLAGVIWVAAAPGAAPESTLQTKLAQRIPLNDIPAEVRDRVRKVIEQPTLFGQGPAEAFGGQPATYEWLLDHPDRALLAWQRLGARCTELTDQGKGNYCWTDGHGSTIQWQTIYNQGSLRIWLAEGKLRPGLLLPLVSVQAVVVLRHGHRADEKNRSLIFHQSAVFVQTDSKTATLVARLLGDSAPRVIEHCMNQFETFYSGIVWYLDQHPERAETLLAEPRKPTP